MNSCEQAIRNNPMQSDYSALDPLAMRTGCPGLIVERHLMSRLPAALAATEIQL